MTGYKAADISTMGPQEKRNSRACNGNRESGSRGPPGCGWQHDQAAESCQRDAAQPGQQDQAKHQAWQKGQRSQHKPDTDEGSDAFSTPESEPDRPHMAGNHDKSACKGPDGRDFESVGCCTHEGALQQVEQQDDGIAFSA